MSSLPLPLSSSPSPPLPLPLSFLFIKAHVEVSQHWVPNVLHSVILILSLGDKSPAMIGLTHCSASPLTHRTMIDSSVCSADGNSGCGQFSANSFPGNRSTVLIKLLPCRRAMLRQEVRGGMDPRDVHWGSSLAVWKCWWESVAAARDWQGARVCGWKYHRGAQGTGKLAEAAF